MAKEKLNRMGRFELLQLIYQIKKSNEELTLRNREAERQIDNLKRENAEQEERLRRNFDQRLDEIRMQGAAKDLQERMKKLEQQLLFFQQQTTQEPAKTTEEPSIPNTGEAERQKPENNIPQKDGE